MIPVALEIILQEIHRKRNRLTRQAIDKVNDRDRTYILQSMLDNPNTCVARLGFGLSNDSDYQTVD